MVDWIKNTYKVLDIKYPHYTKIVRYLVSGGTSAFTNIALLYVFTDFIGIWYIFSAVMSFSVAFIISFTLQKYWTFQDSSKDSIQSQIGIYFIIAIINLFLNTSMLFFQVEYIHIHYLLSQLIAGVIIAVESFFLYKIFVFKNKSIE